MEGKCPRSKDNCAYAHGTEDLRVVSIDEKAKMHLLPSAKKWRTELCFNYTTTGTCRYGSKCAFIHDEVSYLKCKNIPVKDALQFIMESRQNQEQSDINMLNNQLSELKIDIPTNSYSFPHYAASPDFQKQAFTPVPFNTYQNTVLSPTAYTPYQKPNFFIYPKNLPNNNKQYIGTPYPSESPFLNYSYDSPNSNTRSYRLFNRQNKTPVNQDNIPNNHNHHIHNDKSKHIEFTRGGVDLQKKINNEHNQSHLASNINNINNINNNNIKTLSPNDNSDSNVNKSNNQQLNQLINEKQINSNNSVQENQLNELTTQQNEN